MNKQISGFLLTAFLCIALCPVPAAAEGLLLLEEADTPVLLPEEGQTTVLTIREVKALPADTPGVTFRGTVVWTEGETAIVQNGNDSLWLWAAGPLSPGDVILVTGQTGQGIFLSENVTLEETGPLPAMETSLADAPVEVRVVIRGGTLSAGILTQDGCAVTVQAPEIPEGTADVYGILFGDILYADTIVPIAKPNREWNAYFGLLDAHSSLSDGLGTVQEAFSYASQVENLDFFAVTDHSDSLDNAASGEITRDGTTVSAEWAAGKQAAAAVTTEHFVGIFGYEMTWGEDKMVGHINTFATPGWQTPRQSGMESLAGYCAALAKVPDSVSQFNHPSIFYGDFGGFRDYDPACDAAIQLLQVEGEGGESFYPYYIQALDCGWHVAPTVGQDNHHGNWGSEGQSRTAVLAKELTEEALYEAMRARRVYATEDPDLYIDFRLNGKCMGTVMGITEGLEASVVLDDPTDGPSATVEVIGSGGGVLARGDTSNGTLPLSVPEGSPYYFLRVIQPDGDVAVTAPVWVDDFEDMGIAEFTADADNPLAGQTVDLTLALYNREGIPFEITAAALYRNGEKLGDFNPAGDLRYTFPLLWEDPGEVRLTAVVWGTVDGVERSYTQDLTLHFSTSNPTAATIRQVRSGAPGAAYTIKGYATSGNTNPYTTFSHTVYVQDSTGGIPVRGEFTQSIPVGTPLAVTGVLREENGERYLELTDCQVPGEALYRYVPQTLNCREATDYALRGGMLVQVEGTVVSLTSDGTSVSRLILRDSYGNTAQIVIDPEIRSGAYGVNTLAEVVKLDEIVRAIGLLSMEDTGQAVLRVRNCDEVVAVASAPTPASVVADESNPPTGDSWIWRYFADFLR
ncbi:MAG: CehA/McbA family metallohydrolase [Eubacteriales bacterium]|nr:CehA/McbA family metallohydrolase [Eubacteriales bacterium]